MTPRHEPDRDHDDTREPSEVAEAFDHDVTPLAPPPGAYDTVRQRAHGRRRRRVMWAGAAVAGCAAAVALTLTATSGGPTPDSVAVGDTADQRQTPADRGDSPAPPETPHSTPPSTPPSHAPHSPGSAQPPASDPPASGEPKSTGSQPPVCATSDLGISLGQGEGAAGSLYRPLRVTNNGDSACSLYGFPGVSMVDSAGRQVGKPADRAGAQAGGRVVMKPGQREEATLRVLTAAVATDPGCHASSASGIRVYPPGQRASKVVSVPGLKGCASQSVTTLTITSFGVH
ncbi:DUF4232 domain-containing protein [Streptomyces sp. NPDC050560]|uniref:DUF4232 domain-containing protein n=1 Tax=Streptomyces sp. NPDC050560 TaxID=3365630 RepID=UPI0037A57D77